MYPRSSKSNEWCIGRNQSFSLNPHLLECRVVEDINKAPVVYKDSVYVVVPYTYVDHKCIVVRVMETSCIFLYESNYRIVDSCHL